MATDRCDLLCLDLELAERIRREELPTEALAAAASAAKALGDTTRLGLAAHLAQAEELCVCDLAWISGRAENLVSHHLRQLRAAGIVRSRRAGKMVMYSLTERGRKLLDLVLTEPART